MSTRRNEIVRIAARLFAARGFLATTVREIADEAGILSGSLYHHFQSKEDIAYEILDKYYSGMVETFRAFGDEARDSRDALADLIRVSYQEIAHQPDAVALIDNSGEYLLGLPGFEAIAAANEELGQMWLRVLERGISDGSFRADADASLMRTFIRDSLWVAIRWWQPGGRYSIDDIAEQYTRLVLIGLESGPADAPHVVHPRASRAASGGRG